MGSLPKIGDDTELQAFATAGCDITVLSMLCTQGDRFNNNNQADLGFYPACGPAVRSPRLIRPQRLWESYWRTRVGVEHPSAPTAPAKHIHRVRTYVPTCMQYCRYVHTSKGVACIMLENIHTCSRYSCLSGCRSSISIYYMYEAFYVERMPLYWL